MSYSQSNHLLYSCLRRRNFSHENFRDNYLQNEQASVHGDRTIRPPAAAPRPTSPAARGLHLGNGARAAAAVDEAALHVVVVVGDAVQRGRGRRCFLVQTCPTMQEITSSAAMTPSTMNTGVYDPPRRWPRRRRRRRVLPRRPHGVRAAGQKRRRRRGHRHHANLCLVQRELRTIWRLLNITWVNMLGVSLKAGVSVEGEDWNFATFQISPFWP